MTTSYKTYRFLLNVLVVIKASHIELKANLNPFKQRKKAH